MMPASHFFTDYLLIVLCIIWSPNKDKKIFVDMPDHQGGIVTLVVSSDHNQYLITRYIGQKQTEWAKISPGETPGKFVVIAPNGREDSVDLSTLKEVDANKDSSEALKATFTASDGTSARVYRVGDNTYVLGPTSRGFFIGHPASK